MGFNLSPSIGSIESDLHSPRAYEAGLQQGLFSAFKIMKRLFITILASLALGAGLGAQTPASIMARAEKVVSASRTSEASFQSVYYDARGNETGRIAGRMILQGEDFRLEYGSVVAVFSGRTLSYHDSDEQTLTISEPTEEELLQVNPLHFLRGRGKGFSVSRQPDSKTMQMLSFTPSTKGKSNLRQVEIGFLTSSGAPREVVVKGSDASRLVITISDIKPHITLPASSFTLSPKQFPKSEVIDLR